MIKFTVLQPYEQNFFMVKGKTWSDIEEDWASLPMKNSYRLHDRIKEAFEYSDATASHFAEDSINDIIFIVNETLIQELNEAGIANMCAHEAYHVMNYVYKRVGANHDPDNDEPGAYFLGYITGLISEFLNEQD